MKELSPRARAILDAAHAGDAPAAGDKERVRRAVLASVGGAAVGSASVSTAAASTVATTTAAAAATTTAGAATTTATVGSSALASSLLAKLLVAGVAVGTVAGTATLVTWDDSTPSATDFAGAEVAAVSVGSDGDEPPVAPRPGQDVEASIAREADEVGEAPAPVAPEAVDEEPPPAAGPPRAEPATRALRAESHGLRPTAPIAAAPTETLGEEVALLRAVQRARGRGQAAEALRLLQVHATRFPDGTLAAERMAARALTLCELGQATEARAAAERFLAENPTSPLASRVAAACR